MTREFNQRIRCGSCGELTTEESPFERWFRGQPELQTDKGFVRFDLDVLLHRYLTHEDGKSSREIQHMMFIEVKTRMAKPSMAQADTLYVLDQLLRNRRKNMHSSPRRQLESPLTHVYSHYLQRNVRIRLYGGHLLQMNGTCPEDSMHLMWDKKFAISHAQLLGLLTFELNPDNPFCKNDVRRRTGSMKHQMKLFES